MGAEADRDTDVSPPVDPDLDLVDRWVAGDVSAQDQLLHRYYDNLHRFFEVKVGQAAPDLTQNTMIACVKAIHGFQRRSTFKTFLFAIARRQLAYYLRQEQRRADGSGFDEGVYQPDTFTSPSRIVSAREEQRLLLYALEHLPEDQRIAVQLYYWEAMSNREIAAVLDVTITAVTTRLARARQGIRQRVADFRPKPYIAQQLDDNLDLWMRSLIDTHN